MPVINTTPDTSKPPIQPVRKKFADWTLRDAQDAIAWVKDRRVGRDGFAANWAYAQDHEHFMGGQGWIGPDGGEDTTRRSVVRAGVERQFTPVDATAEALDNIANALLQNRAVITLEPLVPAKDPQSEEAKAQQQQAAELVQILLRWCEKRKFWAKTRDAVKRARWATWGTLRAWIPASAAIETTVTTQPAEAPEAGETQAAEEPDQGEQQTTLNLPTGLSLVDALGNVHLSSPPPNQGFVYTDPDSQRQIGIFLYTDDRQEFAELCWVENGKTVSKLLGGTDEDQVDHDLGGRFPLVQMDGDLLITEPVRMQQAQINFAQSILTRVMECAGFAERYVVDAEPEGEWSPTPPTEGVETVVVQIVNGVPYYLIPQDRTLGHSITSEVRAMVDTGPDNVPRPRTPQIIFKEPTDPEYIIKAVKHARATLLRQCKQGHIDMDGEATATGWSRVQARVAHLADVTTMQEPLQGLIRETLEAVLAYAALMSEEAVQLLADFRLVVTVHINIGPVSPDERTAILEMKEKGAISLQTALTMLQVEDVPGEIERIRSQPESQRTTLKQQAELMAIFIRECQMDQALAAQLAGLPPEQVALIRRAGLELEGREEEEGQDEEQQPPGRSAA